MSENVNSRGATYDTGDSGIFTERAFRLVNLNGLTDLIISTSKDNKSVAYFPNPQAQLTAFSEV
ncbi:MAG: hypothetical protein IPG02_10715 [Ignavibacteria bacterium]|nr:hypothetical protein [Ignavibacteria bacterium]